MSDGNRKSVERIFRDARFVSALGIELTACGEGWCETRLDPAPSVRQQHGFVHGGALMTLADHTCGGAAASTVPEGKDVIAVECKITFLRPAAGTALTCRAEVLRAGRSLIFVEAEVMAEGEAGAVLLAKASSTLAVITLGKRAPGDAPRLP